MQDPTYDDPSLVSLDDAKVAELSALEREAQSRANGEPPEINPMPGERCGCGAVWTWHEGRDDERNRWSETLCAEGNRHCMCPGCRATRIVENR